MDPAIAAKLLALNRDFYTRFGEAFSATRQRLQPGVKRVLETFSGDEKILDLGCGNGEFARALTKRGHRGQYLGLDFSLPLLREAEASPEGFSARFLEADLTQLSVISKQLSVGGGWSMITAFAVLHHIPSHELRINLLNSVHALLGEHGRFILSNWQFLNSRKLKARIKPWEAVSLSPSRVDAGDHLLDWRSGGEGLRYVHYFTVQELSALADQTGFRIVDSFLADGEEGKLGLYQIWVPVIARL